MRKRLKHLLRQQSLHKVGGIFVVIAIASIGFYSLGNSHAAMPSIAGEAESGKLTGSASVISDSNASDGEAVKFGTPAGQTWDCTSTVPDSTGNYIASCPTTWPTQWTDPTDLTGGNDSDAAYPYTGTDAYAVDQDVWSSLGGQTQTIQAKATNAGDWQVTANVPTNPTGSITTYPNSGTNSFAGVLDDYTSLTSTNTVSMPSPSSAPNLNAHAMQDDWLDPPGSSVNDPQWNYEVMIQYDHVNDALCNTDAPYSSTDGWNWNEVATDVVFNGQPWYLCDGQAARTTDTCPSGGCGAVVWVPGTDVAHTESFSSITLNLKAMFQWLETHTTPVGDGPSTPVHYMQTGSELFSLSSGFEIASTGGDNVTLGMSSFTVNATGAPSL